MAQAVLLTAPCVGYNLRRALNGLQLERIKLDFPQVPLNRMLCSSMSFSRRGATSRLVVAGLLEHRMRCLMPCIGWPGNMFARHSLRRRRLQRPCLQVERLEKRVVPSLLGNALFPADNPWN